MKNKLLVLLVAIITGFGIVRAESIDLLDSTVTVNESSVFGHSKTVYQYNSKGSLIRQTRIYATWSKWKVGMPMIMNRRAVFVYDDEGHEIDLYYSSLDTATGKWTDDHRYLYDEWHNRTYSVGKWNADSTALLSGVRYFYDSNHFLIGNESFDTWNGVEVVTDKYFYTNDANGYKISMYGQFRPDSAYDGDYKSDPEKFNQSGWKNVDSAYYERNAAGQSIRETFFRWDESNNQWLKDGYQDFTYDAQGHLLTDTVFARDFETNIITYNNMTVREYDSYGNLTRTTTYSPVVSEGETQWQVNDVSVNEYTYNEKGLITLKRSHTDYNDGAEPNYSTTTYYYSHYDLDENGNIVPDPCLIASGTCGAQGDNLTWELSCDSILTISGTGEMANYSNALSVPWYSYNSSIQYVVIGNNVTSIGERAFNNCSGLTSVTIPNSVTSIGYQAFYVCTGLTSVTIPGSVISVGDYAFYKCSGLTSLTIEEGVKSLGLNTFSRCSSLTEVTIPESVTTLGIGATFQYCTVLTKVQWNALNCVIETNENGRYFITFTDDKNINTFAFGDNVEFIPPYICGAGLPELKKVDLSSSVTNIGEGAFLNCTGLTSITCEAVTPPALDNYVFYGVDKSIPLYVPSASIAAYKATAGWKDFTNIQPIEGTFPVTFLDYNGEVLSEQNVAYNQAATAPEVPAREGYTFSGWSTNIEHIVARTFAIALYDKIGGTLTYLSEEGDVIATENVDLHLPAAPIIAGKSFKGWLTESADSENGIVLRATYTFDNPNTHDDVTITPSSNSAYVIFPFITGALTYQLVIRDLFGNVVCKIMFSATGHLLGIAFAPSRNRESQQATQTTGFNFTVEGLDANTTYEYEFVANDDTDEVIETLSGSFTTTAEVPTDNEQVNNPSAVRKYLEDGHLMIDANSHIFNTQGKMIK